MSFQFVKQIFSEADGTASFARVATGILVAFALGWVTHIVWKLSQLPDLSGLAMLIGTLYGLNKFATAIEKKP